MEKNTCNQTDTRCLILMFDHRFHKVFTLFIKEGFIYISECSSGQLGALRWTHLLNSDWNIEKHLILNYFQFQVYVTFQPKLMVDSEKENIDSRYVEYTDHISSEVNLI